MMCFTIQGLSYFLFRCLVLLQIGGIPKSQSPTICDDDSKDYGWGSGWDDDDYYGWSNGGKKSGKSNKRYSWNDYKHQMWGSSGGRPWWDTRRKLGWGWDGGKKSGKSNKDWSGGWWKPWRPAECEPPTASPAPSSKWGNGWDDSGWEWRPVKTSKSSKSTTSKSGKSWSFWGNGWKNHDGSNMSYETYSPSTSNPWSDWKSIWNVSKSSKSSGWSDDPWISHKPKAGKEEDSHKPKSGKSSGSWDPSWSSSDYEKTYSPSPSSSSGNGGHAKASGSKSSKSDGHSNLSNEWSAPYTSNGGWAVSTSKSSKSHIGWSDGLDSVGHKPKADKSKSTKSSLNMHNATHVPSASGGTDHDSKSGKSSASWSSGVSISGKYTAGESDNVNDADDSDQSRSTSKSAKSHYGWSDSWNSGVSVSGKYAVEAKSSKSSDRGIVPETLSKIPSEPHVAKPRNDPLVPGSAQEPVAPGTKANVNNSKGLANGIAFSGSQEDSQDSRQSGETKSAASAACMSMIRILLPAAVAVFGLYI